MHLRENLKSTERVSRAEVLEEFTSKLAVTTCYPMALTMYMYIILCLSINC